MNKKIYYLILLSFLSFSFVSCIDEKDFDMDRLAQTTINPSLNVGNVLQTEVKLSDFFDLDAIADTMNGFSIEKVTDANGDYLNFIFSKDTIVKPNLPELNNIPTTNLNLENISFTPNILLNTKDEYFPLITVLQGTETSINIPKLNDSQVLDSILFKGGDMILTVTSDLNFDAHLIVESPSFVCNGKTYIDTIRISTAGQSGSRTSTETLDLSKYTVKVDNQSKIKFYTRIWIEKHNTELTKSSYNVNAKLDFNNLDFDIAYGKMITYNHSFNGAIDINLFSTNSTLENIFKDGKFNLEKIGLDIQTNTNIGAPASFDFIKLQASSKTSLMDLLGTDRTMTINYPNRKHEYASTQKIFDLNTSVLNIIPNKIEYDALIKLNPNNQQGFITSDASFAVKYKFILPFKAVVNDLIYDIDIDKLDLGDIVDIEYATLLVDIENFFPVSMSAQLYSIDKNNVSTPIFTNPLTVKGANVNSMGKVTSSTKSNSKAEVKAEKLDVMKNADKMKLTLTLNTSKDASDAKPFIRFEKDSKIKVKLGIDSKTKITI